MLIHNQRGRLVFKVLQGIDQEIQEVVLKMSKEYSDKMVEQVGIDPSIT